MAGPEAELEPLAAGIAERGDPLAGGELALRALALLRRGATAEPERALVARQPLELRQPVRAALVVGLVALQVRIEDRHRALPPVAASYRGARRPCATIRA
jgi:hypothetical protein